MFLALGRGTPAAAEPQVSTAVKLRVVELARQGKDAFNARRFDEALRYWGKAYGLWPKPQLLFNLALAHAGAKHPVRAFTFIRAFLALAPKMSAGLKRLLPAAHRLRDEVRPNVALLKLSGPAGTMVWVDGVRTRALGEELVLKPGARRLRLQAPDGRILRKDLELEAGASTVLAVVFPKPRDRPRVVEPPPRRRVVGSGPFHTPPPPPRKRGIHMAFALGTLGLAAITAGAAIGTGVAAKRAFDDFGAVPTPGNRDKVRRLASATNALWGVAGAAGVAAVVLAIFTRWRTPRAEAAAPAAARSWRVGPGPGGLGVQLSGRY